MWQFYCTVQYIEYCWLYTAVVEEPSFHRYFRKVSKIMNNFMHVTHLPEDSAQIGGANWFTEQFLLRSFHHECEHCEHCEHNGINHSYNM